MKRLVFWDSSERSKDQSIQEQKRLFEEIKEMTIDPLSHLSSSQK